MEHHYEKSINSVICYTGVPSGGREDVCAGYEGVAGVERELACTLASRSGGNLHVTSTTTQIMQYESVLTLTCCRLAPQQPLEHCLPFGWGSSAPG